MVHSVSWPGDGARDGGTSVGVGGWASAWDRICCCHCIDRGQRSCAEAPRDAGGTSIAACRRNQFFIVNLVILINDEAYLHVTPPVLKRYDLKTSWQKQNVESNFRMDILQGCSVV
jgi:hypothetical protein